MIMGAKTDPDFGPMLMAGRGGIYAPIDRDTQFRLTPLSREDARDMFTGLRASAILRGYRGKRGVDFEDLENTVLRLSQFMTDFPEVAELDINPYMALPVNAGTSMAVDARIVLNYG